MMKICDLSIAGERVEVWTDGDSKAWLKRPHDALLSAEREIRIFPEANDLLIDDQDANSKIAVEARISMELAIHVEVIR